MQLISRGADMTKNIGKILGQSAFRGMIIALNGPMGAGKTAFTNGFVSAFSNQNVVSSPTFSIMNVYECDIPIYHFDFYRIMDTNFDIFEFEEYIYSDDGIALIEWSCGIDLDDDVLNISIEICDDETRKITLECKSQKYIDYLMGIEKELKSLKCGDNL